MRDKFKNKAVFCDGQTIIRTSVNIYTHAVGHFHKGKMFDCTFASSLELAEKSATTSLNKSVKFCKKDRRDEFKKELTFEIVEVEIAA